MPSKPTKEPTKKEIIKDLQSVGPISRREYALLKRYSPWTIERLFGSWSAAQQAAGVDATPIERLERQEQESRLKREYNELLYEVRSLREIVGAWQKLSKSYKPPKILRREKSSGIREMTAVVQGSDWHVDETVESVKVSGRNEYNLDIADRSIERFFNGACDLVEHHRSSGKVAIRNMVMAFSGDLTSGHIHEELSETTSMAPLQTMQWIAPRIRNGIYTTLDRLGLESIVVPWSYGNHGRYHKKPRIATGAEHNFEWALGVRLAEDFKDDKRVVFDVNPSPHQYAQVYDFNLHFHHGDSLKYAGGVGGLGIPLLKAVPAWDAVHRCDYHYIGHFHQLRDYGVSMVNGSMIGYGPYSAWIRAPFEVPQQLFHLIDSKRGKCHFTPIWVRE